MVRKLDLLSLDIKVEKVRKKHLNCWKIIKLPKTKTLKPSSLWSKSFSKRFTALCCLLIDLVWGGKSKS